MSPPVDTKSISTLEYVERVLDERARFFEVRLAAQERALARVEEKLAQLSKDLVHLRELKSHLDGRLVALGVIGSFVIAVLASVLAAGVWNVFFAPGS